MTMRGPDPKVAQAFLDGECPIRPSLDDDLRTAIEEHKSIVTIRPAEDLVGWDAARAALRCASGIVDGGATAVRCRGSGLAHSADRISALERMAEGAETEGNRSLLGEALYLALVMPYTTRDRRARTLGMALLEASDVFLAGPLTPSNAMDAMEALCLRVLSGRPPKHQDVVRAGPESPALRVEHIEDATEGADHNPFGMWQMTPLPRGFKNTRS
ncbi:MAG: hypothetical protein AAGA48_13495 [Myxococcota bacterium]